MLSIWMEYDSNQIMKKRKISNQDKSNHIN